MKSKYISFHIKLVQFRFLFQSTLKNNIWDKELIINTNTTSNHLYNKPWNHRKIIPPTKWHGIQQRMTLRIRSCRSKWTRTTASVHRGKWRLDPDLSRFVVVEGHFVQSTISPKKSKDTKKCKRISTLCYRVHPASIPNFYNFKWFPVYFYANHNFK